MSLFIGIAALWLLAGLLLFEYKQHLPGKALTKLPLSGLFILTALLQIGPRAVYTHLLLAGLTCCLVGDGCLVFTRRGFLLAGLTAFLLGHCFYVAAFLSLSGFNIGLLVGLVLACPPGYAVFRWLQPHLDDLRRPVAAYIVVISLMVCTALIVFFETRLPMPSRWLVLIGALSFYFSDLFVARQRFVHDSFINRLAGLPLYYGGQFCLAFSVGVV